MSTRPSFPRIKWYPHHLPTPPLNRHNLSPTHSQLQSLLPHPPPRRPLPVCPLLPLRHRHRPRPMLILSNLCSLFNPAFVPAFVLAFFRVLPPSTYSPSSSPPSLFPFFLPPLPSPPFFPSLLSCYNRYLPGGDPHIHTRPLRHSAHIRLHLLQKCEQCSKTCGSARDVVQCRVCAGVHLQERRRALCRGGRGGGCSRWRCLRCRAWWLRGGGYV
ncbi:hypothetical protein BU23DRAFT_301305 [Bimuria novae-zelandiae CBS 107.79]|uniref:Uncharacterized protein n=1 Tax=Bimuria novae-zelandiae CBS 107.79 TaxID=1447943 RepID=A0A6A5UWF8_9PLEO|nr:hypothetical protein BU23DRAFT_301305 [Bimuria novae-zelandiae CBS 107.79]